jgi:hypothetical protein
MSGIPQGRLTCLVSSSHSGFFLILPPIHPHITNFPQRLLKGASHSNVNRHSPPPPPPLTIRDLQTSRTTPMTIIHIYYISIYYTCIYVIQPLFFFYFFAYSYVLRSRTAIQNTYIRTLVTSCTVQDTKWYRTFWRLKANIYYGAQRTSFSRILFQQVRSTMLNQTPLNIGKCR